MTNLILKEKTKIDMLTNIIDFYSDTKDSELIETKYFVVNLIDDIENILLEELNTQVEDYLKNDIDYIELNSEKEKEEYIEENRFHTFLELTTDLRSNMYDYIINYYKDLNYDCYEGEFFPLDGYFKNLNYNQIAFVINI